MENKTIIYIGIAAVAYYLYIKSQEFKFTEGEKNAINAIAKGDPLKYYNAFKTVLGTERLAIMQKYFAGDNAKIFAALKPTTT
jgi:hypothetical protein